MEVATKVMMLIPVGLLVFAIVGGMIDTALRNHGCVRLLMNCHRLRPSAFRP